MTGPNDQCPMTQQERIEADYFYMEKYAPVDEDWLEVAAEIMRDHAEERRTKEL